MVQIQITKAQYNYLIAVPEMRRMLLARRELPIERFFFTGNAAETADMWRRMEGLSW